MNRLVGLLSVGLLGLCCAGTTSKCDAALQVYTFGTEISGSGAVIPGIAVATFDDMGTAGTVRLTLDLTGVTTTTPFISEWFFQSVVDINTILISYNAGLSTGPDSDPVSNGGHPGTPPNFGGPGTPTFEWSLGFGTSNAGGGAARLNGGEIVVFDLSATGLLASNFFDPTEALYQSGFHMQGLATGSGSGWFVPTGPNLTVPEPGTFFLLGSGIVGAFGVARRRKNSMNSTS